jgi:hypothetical protein
MSAKVMFQDFILGKIQYSLPMLVHLTHDQENLREISYRYAIKATLGLPSSNPTSVTTISVAPTSVTTISVAALQSLSPVGP